MQLSLFSEIQYPFPKNKQLIPKNETISKNILIHIYNSIYASAVLLAVCKYG